MVKREYTEVPLAAVGAVIIDTETQEVLLIKRGSEPAKGKYSIPGGLIELGETALDAVIREVKEEVGIDIAVLGIINISDIIERDSQGRVRWHYVLIDFLARPLNKNVRAADDALEAFWIPLQKALDYDLTSHTRELFIRISKSRSISFLSLDGRCSLLFLGKVKK